VNGNNTLVRLQNREAQVKIASLFVSGAVLIAAAVASGGAFAQGPSTKPNIVFILMDNLGYGEVGVYGGGITRGAPTPRIDQIAAEGTRLTNFNVEAQCTPSRSAIMTGRFSIRSGTHSVPIGGGPEGLTQWEVTIAETLSAAGYATGAFGKWHLAVANKAAYPTTKALTNGMASRARPTKLSGREILKRKPQAFPLNISWREARARRAESFSCTI
jgi:arylsulfatase A-like enzyme